MNRWCDCEREAPELAALVRCRFEATGLGFLATLRADGSPRLSGIEPWFVDDDVWLAMMPEARKRDDLTRDPRLALHSASIDKDVVAGDAKLTGSARDVTGAAREPFLALIEERTGDRHDEAAVFRVALREVSFLRPAGDHLEITVWTPGGPARTVDKY